MQIENAPRSISAVTENVAMPLGIRRFSLADCTIALGLKNRSGSWLLLLLLLLML
jgi:hypothetical protein